MNPTTIRLFKEARTLFPLWCFVAIAGGLRLVQQQWPGGMTGMIGYTNVIEAATFLGFFVGIPLLATLSIGSEFQYGTFAFLLSQPISRTRIWGEKVSVTIVAVGSTALIFGYAWRSEVGQPQFRMTVVWLIATIASALYWTLIARSTIGGVALNLTAFLVLGIPAGLFRPWQDEIMTATWPAALAALCYGGLMLWLGVRKLARFQVTGGLAGDDLMTAGPQFMPEALARPFRSRPSGAFLNLIRKELRLQRPVWLITLLIAFGWFFLTAFWPERGWPSTAAATAIVFLISFTLLIAVLAGSLSLGEERASGTHVWHLTLPVSARRQWLIKLVMALFTSLVGAWMLPFLLVATVGFVRGSNFISLGTPTAWLIEVLFLTFAAFWCACAVNGTWPAVAWLFLALGVVYAAGRFGNWIGQLLAGTTGTLREIFISWLHLDPQAFLGSPTIVASILLAIAPASLLALNQSYRMFRTEPQDNVLGIARRLLALALVVLLCGFSVSASGIGRDVFPVVRGVARWHPLYETARAIEKLQSGSMANLAHPLQLTVEDLARAAPLSPLTQRWLRDSRIIIAPSQTPVGPFAQIAPVATIHLASGLDCGITFTYINHAGKLIHTWSSCALPER